jgi:hypothetical protein
MNCTLCVKLSLLFHVTVDPTGTLMEAGTYLYDGGRSTTFVATGDDGAGLPVHATAMSAAAANDAAARNDAVVRSRSRTTWPVS